MVVIKMVNIHTTIHTTNLEGKTYQVGYKVVTSDLKSLGLRKNPNILEYPIGEWYFLPKEQVFPGKDDWGGIWVIRTFSTAKKLEGYMRKYHKKETRIFKTCLAEILYYNSYRIKTNGILMFEEIEV